MFFFVSRTNANNVSYLTDVEALRHDLTRSRFTSRHKIERAKRQLVNYGECNCAESSRINVSLKN